MVFNVHYKKTFPSLKSIFFQWVVQPQPRLGRVARGIEGFGGANGEVG